MMNVDYLIAKIPIPAEAVLPLVIGCVALFALLLAGGALADWKERSPNRARWFGIAVAVVCTGYAVYSLVGLVPASDMKDPVYSGVRLIGNFDAPIAGFLAVIGAVMWRYANERWIALGVGAVLGLAMLVKPFVVPLNSSGHYWGILDLEHIAFLASGAAVLLAGVLSSRPPVREAASYPAASM